jgi:arginase family enzyme
MEYGIDISKIRFTDYGNIDVAEDKNLEDLLEKLSSKVERINEKSGIPIIVGGTKELVYSCLKGISKRKENLEKKLGVMAI